MNGIGERDHGVTGRPGHIGKRALGERRVEIVVDEREPTGGRHLVEPVTGLLRHRLSAHADRVTFGSGDIDGAVRVARRQRKDLLCELGHLQARVDLQVDDLIQQLCPGDGPHRRGRGLLDVLRHPRAGDVVAQRRRQVDVVDVVRRLADGSQRLLLAVHAERVADHQGRNIQQLDARSAVGRLLDMGDRPQGVVDLGELFKLGGRQVLFPCVVRQDVSG